VKRRTDSTTMVGNFRDWSEFVESLTSHHVRFVIVGAHALAVLGRPRHTGDLDVFVEPTAANARRLGAALRHFGFDAHADEAHQLAIPERMMTLGKEPVRIDITNSMSDLTFDEAWRGRIRRRINGQTVYFLGRREYIKNKQAASKRPSRRVKDLADIAMLDLIDKKPTPKRHHGRYTKNLK
jgi:predicted nucleotidyltransferase